MTLLCRGGHVLLPDDVRRETAKIVAWLSGCGVPRGALLALRMPSGPGAVLLTLACMEYGVCAPTDPLRTGQAERLGDVVVLGTTADEHADLRVAIDDDGCLGELLPRRLGKSVVVRPGLAGYDLVLQTSGTTGERKLVPHTSAAIRHAAELVAATLRLQPDDRCLNVMPVHHTHGLIGAVLSSLTAGASVVCLPGFAEQDFVRALNDQVTWYTAVPSVHRRVADLVSSGAGTPHRLRFARSASAPLSPALQREVERALGVPLLQTYALTEAPGQITAERPDEARVAYGAVGRPYGCQVRVREGRVQVRGDHVCRGYLDKDDHLVANPGGWLETGDLGRFDDTGALWLAGRVSEVINRAGEKILPLELEEPLRDCPGVADVAVFAIPDEALGEAVGCAVVGDPAAVPEFARMTVGRAPDVVLTVDAIPMAGVGKVDRRALAGRVGRAAPGAPGDIEAEVTRLWRQVLPVAGPDEHFLDAGGASLQGMRLELLVGQAFGVRLPAGCAFGRGATIRGMSAVVWELLQGAG